MRSPRFAVGVAAAVFTLPLFIVVGLPATAGADAIAQKKAEASRLEDQIEAQGERLSILVERYNEAHLDVDRVTADVMGARRRLEAAQRETASVRDKVRQRAVTMYQASSLSTPLDYFRAHDLQDAAIRAAYASAVAARNDSQLSELRRATEDLTLERSRLEADMKSARAVQSRLNGQRDAVARAMVEQQATLARVQGELAKLVAEEQARRRAAAAARARAALGRRSSRGIVNMANVPAPNARAGVAVDVAKAQIGKPYKWGAAGPNSFDCSGLTMYAWGKAGVSLPHSAAAQYNSLPHVPVDSLAPGDLVFYGHSIHHVGIYIGGGQMINAPQTGETVRVDSIFRRDFAGAARPG
jgi:cell wall-associated NlpC family hydrolase